MPDVLASSRAPLRGGLRTGPDGLPLSGCARPAVPALTFRGRAPPQTRRRPQRSGPHPSKGEPTPCSRPTTPIGRDGIVELLDALSDTPVTPETHAWFIGHTRNAAVLEQRLAGLAPDAQPIVRADHVAAWASRRRSATIVYWSDNGALNSRSTTTSTRR